MALNSDLLDHYKLDADQLGDYVIHYSYRSDRACGLRKVKVEEKWDDVRPIGYGSFGEVWQQKRNSSNEQRAVKVLRKHQMKSWGIHYEREIEALAKFNKAQFRQEEVIVQFYGWWESEHSVHLAMEYFEMGDLSNFISEAKTTEQDAKDIAEDLLRALVMIHSQGFTHRDLKPQNIFVVQTSPRYWVKLGDFGISKRVLNQSTALRTEVGTRAFSAPETTPDDYEETFQYNNAVDMWSLGCVIYNVLAHSLPYKNFPAKSLPFPTQPLKDRVDDQGINFLECLLGVDPSTRWTAQKAIIHPWLHASGEASSAAAEDATENASSVAQSERPNENQDKRHHPDDQVDMPTIISSMEKICPKPADRTETPINQSTSQSSGNRGKNGQSNLSSNNDGRRRTRSNMLISPSNNRISDSFQDPGSETLMPRRASYRLPKDASRGLHESDTITKTTSSPQMPTVVSRPPTIGLRTSYSSTDDEDEGVKRGLHQGDIIKKPTSPSIMPTMVSRPSNIGLGTSPSNLDDKDDGATRGLHEGDTIKKPTSSPVMPPIVSRPSNIGFGTSYSSSNDVGEVKIRMKMSDGKTVSLSRLPKSEEQAPEKMEPVTTLRDLPQYEEQAPEKMELVTTLRDLYTQKGHPKYNKIARALELIRNGVDLEMRSRGETAVHLAVRICCSDKGGYGNRILHKLLEGGADVDALNEGGETALQTMIFLRCIAEQTKGAWAEISPTETALQAAVRSNVRNHNQNRIETIRELLRYKANVNAKYYSSCSPLHYAALLSCGEYIDVLLAAGARVNELDNDGETALHGAVRNKYQGQIIARKLILAGIDINVVNKSGMTALDMAQNLEMSGVVEVIEEAQEQFRRSHKNGKDAYSRRPKGTGKIAQLFPFLSLRTQ